MLIVCKCLNIILETAHEPTDNGKGEEVYSAILEYQKNQQIKIYRDHLHFLKKALGPLTTVKISVQQCDLVQVVTIDEWDIHQCIHCKNVTHAVNGQCQYLLNSESSINHTDLMALKQHDNYSSTFGILINAHLTDYNKLQKNNNDDVKCEELERSFRDALKRQYDETAQRIKEYSDQQFELLRITREKADLEYKFLAEEIRTVPDWNPVRISGSEETPLNHLTMKTVLDTPPATPESIPMSIGNSPNFKQQTNVAFKSAIPPSKTKNTLRHSPLLLQQQQLRQSVEEHGFFFDMDGFTTENFTGSGNAIMSDVDESDSDESNSNVTDGISIPRPQARPKSLSIAQSLPIAMPEVNNRPTIVPDLDDDDEDFTNATCMDIAASIKAMAKSLHGDAIFGDLPRPRFRTQI